MLIADEELLNS